MEIEQFLCRFAKFFHSVVSKHRFTCVGRRSWENNLKKLLFYCFRTLSRKNLNFQQNSKTWFSKLFPTCPEEQFRNFSEATITVSKFWVFQRKDRISRGIFYAGLPKAHFTCPLQNFEKKLIKVNFAACGFFRALCDFSKSDRKLSPGRQNHKLVVRRKRLRRFFSVANVCSNIFVFWADELGNSAEKY